MKISMGCDHGGYLLKEHVKKYLTDKGHEIVDCGCNSLDSCDYPQFGAAAAKAVAEGSCERGIVICTTGIGISITANKVKGIRCALCSEPLSAEMTRKHNNANMLAMGAGMTGPNMAERIVDTFLTTEFEGGRHQRRVDGIAAVEAQQ
ncbi:MAG: ribose 5-phosphate isomerase B [Oscillospiraceae bacterium]|nr:ribose 5-phosphate isomerase B [Oscillospiraceae bacterium]